MKAIFSLFVILLLTSGFASAQSAANYTRHTYSSYESSKNPDYNLRPTIGGVFVDSVRYGWVLVSPSAPAKYGHGEKYVTPPVGTYSTHYVGNPQGMRDVQGLDGAKETRTAGGIILFSFNF